VIRLSFEAADELFQSLYTFTKGLIRSISRELKMQKADAGLIQQWEQPVFQDLPFSDLSDRITQLCSDNEKKIVLMIDVVDKSANNQIFLSFLGLLRNKYLEQQQRISPAKECMDYIWIFKCNPYIFAGQKRTF